MTSLVGLMVLIKQFPITVEGEQVIVQQDQLMITLNGVIQAPGESYQVVGGNLVFAEPPKPPSKVNYREFRCYYNSYLQNCTL